jgi:hypothetical protein
MSRAHTSLSWPAKAGHPVGERLKQLQTGSARNLEISASFKLDGLLLQAMTIEA